MLLKNPFVLGRCNVPAMRNRPVQAFLGRRWNRAKPTATLSSSTAASTAGEPGCLLVGMPVHGVAISSGSGTSSATSKIQSSFAVQSVK